jgi:hypothetical protein
VVGSMSTASALQSILLLLEPELFPVRESNGCSVLSTMNYFSYASSLMFCLGSEGKIAPVNCVCAYTSGLGSRLRPLAISPAHYEHLLVGIETRILNSSQLAFSLPTPILDRDPALIGFTPPPPGPVWEPLISPLSKGFLRGQMNFS